MFFLITEYYYSIIGVSKDSAKDTVQKTVHKNVRIIFPLFLTS